MSILVSNGPAAEGRGTIHDPQSRMEEASGPGSVPCPSGHRRGSSQPRRPGPQDSARTTLCLSVSVLVRRLSCYTVQGPDAAQGAGKPSDLLIVLDSGVREQTAWCRAQRGHRWKCCAL